VQRPWRVVRIVRMQVTAQSSS